jgi:putative intracellular protease/amidase
VLIELRLEPRGPAGGHDGVVEAWGHLARPQPFWIEDEARKLADTNFIVESRFKAHATRDGNLITGQQQYSGTAPARLLIAALGR